jgi:hypothetical protein
LAEEAEEGEEGVEELLAGSAAAAVQASADALAIETLRMTKLTWIPFVGVN